MFYHVFNNDPLKKTLHNTDKRNKSKIEQSSKHLPYQFKIGLNDVDGIILGGGVVARPLQFQLGNFKTMNGII
jgi:hypothetical protein